MRVSFAGHASGLPRKDAYATFGESRCSGLGGFLLYDIAFNATGTVLFAGVGGQGVILAGDALGEAAFCAGMDVKKSEIHGLSRRFGSVSCQVRFGQELLSPLRGHGAVDMIVAFEIQEGLRALPYLKREGVALVNRLWIAPHGSASALAPDDLEETVDRRVLWVEGDEETHRAGNPKCLNFYMAGAASAFLPIPDFAWHDALKSLLPPKHWKVNERMFEAGRNAAERLTTMLMTAP